MQLLPAFVGAPERNKVYNLDWHTLTSALPDQSVDAYITDLPYGTTACTWDEIIPFEPMWKQVKRTLKPRGVFVTTASQPFTSKLVMSNLDWFRYEWIWDKVRPVGFQIAKFRPMMQHENVLVFSSDSPNYYPQMKPRLAPRAMTGAYSKSGSNPLAHLRMLDGEYSEFYPASLLTYSNANQTDRLHPTQKPVALYEYLIRTYTQPGDLVVDFCAGSGTTALAARNTGRTFIIGDSDAHYCNVARERLRTSILEPHYVKSDDDVTTLPVKDGYEAHLFAMAANA